MFTRAVPLAFIATCSRKIKYDQMSQAPELETSGFFLARAEIHLRSSCGFGFDGAADTLTLFFFDSVHENGFSEAMGVPREKTLHKQH